MKKKKALKPKLKVRACFCKTGIAQEEKEIYHLFFYFRESIERVFVPQFVLKRQEVMEDTIIRVRYNVSLVICGRG